MKYKHACLNEECVNEVVGLKIKNQNLRKIIDVYEKANDEIIENSFNSRYPPHIASRAKIEVEKIRIKQ